MTTKNRKEMKMDYTKNSVTRRNFAVAQDIATMLNYPLPNTEVQRITLCQGLSERTLYPSLINEWSPACIYDEISYFGGEGELTVMVIRHDFNVTKEDRERGNYIFEMGYGFYKLDFETINYN